MAPMDWRRCSLLPYSERLQQTACHKRNRAGRNCHGEKAARSFAGRPPLLLLIGAAGSTAASAVGAPAASAGTIVAGTTAVGTIAAGTTAAGTTAAGATAAGPTPTCTAPPMPVLFLVLLPVVPVLLLLTLPPCLSAAVSSSSVAAAICSPPDDPARFPARSVFLKSPPHPPSERAPAEMPCVSQPSREPAPRSREPKRSVSSSLPCHGPCARLERSRVVASSRGTVRLVRARVVTLHGRDRCVLHGARCGVAEVTVCVV